MNSSYLRLVLQTTKVQALSLLSNPTPTQALLLSEICCNLLTLPMTEKEQKIVEKYKSLLKKLAKKENTTRYRIKILSKNQKEIYKILKVFKEQLLHLV